MKVENREPSHNETGGSYSYNKTSSHGSPASRGASMGSGPYAGAGQLPPVGPGKAAQRFAGRDASVTPNGKTPPGTAPKGMKTYREE